MAEKFLLHVDLDEKGHPKLNGLDIETVRCLDRVVVTASSDPSRDVLAFIQREFRSLTITVDARRLETVSSVTSLLNAGAARAIVSEHLFQTTAEDGALEDLSRLYVALPGQAGTHLQSSVISWAEGTESLANLIRSKQDLTTDEATAKHFLGTKPTIVVSNLGQWDAKAYRLLVDEGVIPIVSASEFTTNKEQFPNKAPVDVLLRSILRSDRSDDLFTTIVVDERDRCLGMVYSSGESVAAAIHSRRGVYKSRKRDGLWVKGETSGDVQELIKIGMDCDADTLLFKVRQKGDGFCHLKTDTCFGPYTGLSKLEKTIKSRAASAPPNSYTRRLFNEPKLLEAKILEEASELGQAQTENEVASEAADLIYFALTKCVASGVDLRDVERNLDLKSLKVTRRKGDAKAQWAEKVGLPTNGTSTTHTDQKPVALNEASGVPKQPSDYAGSVDGEIRMQRYVVADSDPATLKHVLERPSQRSGEETMKIVRGIIDEVRSGGDEAVLKYTHRFEKATSLTSPILRAPYPEHLMKLDEKTKAAIDVSFANIRLFHAAQEIKPLHVETMSGVVCSRFSRPIERVGLYVPGGTAVLPSSAMMLGVPAMVAGCRSILLASPPRANGTVTPEIVYIAHKVNAEGIVLAGGAQAVAAMAYGTEKITKVDKILGPGNQFVTAAKMLVSNDTTARVAIDMPAGPSEVLVIADKTANPAFVAADLLSQAEHGPDSQVVLIAIDLTDAQLRAIEQELHTQAHALPRVDIVRGAINHSVTLCVRDIQEALRFSNEYAPEHLILQIQDPEAAVELVENAGSVFIGHWTPESVGDYSAGVNHSLPTYGYAKQYSGVNLASFTKSITSSKLTQDGLRNVGGAVMQLAGVEGLDAHARAVAIRLADMDRGTK